MIQIRSNKTHIEPIVNELCSKIHSQEFQAELEKLGLGPGSDVFNSNDKVDLSNQSNQVFWRAFFKMVYRDFHYFDNLETFEFVFPTTIGIFESILQAIEQNV